MGMNAIRSIGRVLVVVGLAALCVPVWGQVANIDEYEQDILDWHAWREEGLRRETGWFSVVGLFPLEQGTNTFGSSEESHIRFPDGAPGHAGVLELDVGEVTIIVEPGVAVFEDGVPVNRMQMIPDTEEGTTVLHMKDRFQFYVIERAGRQYLRLKDRQSRALKEFTHVERFDVDPAWRIEGRWESYDPPKKIKTPNVLGHEVEEECPGVATFEVHGETYQLEPTGKPEEYLWFVFGDATNEHETYAGGRFMYTDPPDSNGVVVLDFNKCYNPPCVFTPFATCPLPRPVNKLSIRIEAGERMYYVEGH